MKICLCKLQKLFWNEFESQVEELYSGKGRKSERIEYLQNSLLKFHKQIDTRKILLMYCFVNKIAVLLCTPKFLALTRIIFNLCKLVLNF